MNNFTTQLATSLQKQRYTPEEAHAAQMDIRQQKADHPRYGSIFDAAELLVKLRTTGATSLTILDQSNLVLSSIHSVIDALEFNAPYLGAPFNPGERAALAGTLQFLITEILALSDSSGINGLESLKGSYTPILEKTRKLGGGAFNFMFQATAGSQKKKITKKTVWIIIIIDIILLSIGAFVFILLESNMF